MISGRRFLPALMIHKLLAQLRQVQAGLAVVALRFPDVIDETRHLVHGMIRCLDHVINEFRVVPVFGGVAHQQGQLCDQRLQKSCTMKADALLTASNCMHGAGEAVLGIGLGEEVAELAPDNPYQVEVFPVEIHPGVG